MTKIDLQKFCADETEPREFIKAPFSEGEYTYATDGHVMVRVKRIAAFDENKKPTNMHTFFSGALPVCIAPPFKKADFSHINKKNRMEECRSCLGTGKITDGSDHCETCTCEEEPYKCRDCNGSGKVKSKISILLSGVPFDLAYLFLLSELPDLKIEQPPLKDNIKMYFTFDGGDGYLMPLRCNYSNHISLQDLNPILKAEEVGY